VRRQSDGTWLFVIDNPGRRTGYLTAISGNGGAVGAFKLTKTHFAVEEEAPSYWRATAVTFEPPPAGLARQSDVIVVSGLDRNVGSSRSRRTRSVGRGARRPVILAKLSA
jgi:hypothetical protein